MSKMYRRPVWEQLELFRARPPRPTWKSLPQEVCRKVLPLLARLLKTAHGQSGVAAKEVSDE